MTLNEILNKISGVLRLEHDDVAGFKPKIVFHDSDSGEPTPLYAHDKDGKAQIFPLVAFLLNNTDCDWRKRYKTAIYFEITTEDTAGSDAGIWIVHNAKKFTKAAASQGMVLEERGMGTVVMFLNNSRDGNRGGPMGAEFGGLPGRINSSWDVRAGSLGQAICLKPGRNTDGVAYFPSEGPDDGQTAFWLSSSPDDVKGEYRHTEYKLNGDVIHKPGAMIRRRGDAEGIFERIAALENELAELKSKGK